MKYSNVYFHVFIHVSRAFIFLYFEYIFSLKAYVYLFMYKLYEFQNVSLLLKSP